MVIEPGFRNTQLSAFIFFLCLILLTASGRLASLDAGAQLQATMLLARTGNLGTRTVPANTSKLWVQGQNGLYYECHDIGNVALMLPAAMTAEILSKVLASDDREDPSLIARVLVSLTCAALSAVACLFIFKLLLLGAPLREAFFLTCAFIVFTFFWAYTKAAWDVLGACCFVCMLLYSSAMVLNGPHGRRSLLWSCTFLSAAGAFRYSLLPFLGLALAIVVIKARSRLRGLEIVWALATIVTLTAPTFLYNWVRMGSILRPATMATQYVAVGTGDLSGNLWHGLWGLLFSPNKGLFAFSPVLLLLFALPLTWRSLGSERRILISSFGLGALLYTATIAKLPAWGTFGWGPRYLLPILPICFVAAAPCMAYTWKKRSRLLVVVLLAFSALATVPPAIANWSLTIGDIPRDLNADALTPNQQIDTLNELIRGLRGQPSPHYQNDTSIKDPVRKLGAGFPDMWTFYLMKASKNTFVSGLGLTLMLAAGAIWSLWATCRQ